MTPLERRNYALACARLRMLPGKDRTLLTTEAVDAVCETLLLLATELQQASSCTCTRATPPFSPQEA